MSKAQTLPADVEKRFNFAFPLLDHRIDRNATLTNMLIKETKQFLSTELSTQKAEMVKMIKGMKKEQFVEAHDNDSHRYQIPRSKIEEWRLFCEIPPDDERSWDVPAWADRIDGMPITDFQSYNQALEDLLDKLNTK